MERLQRFDRLKDQFRSGEQVTGGWVSIPHGEVAELTARHDYDFVCVDMEHAPTDVSDLGDLVRGIDAAPGETVPLVRVPGNDEVVIKRALDAGVGGLMVPRIDTAADAEAVVAASTYPPEGIRGTAGTRASGFGADLPAYLDGADDALTRIVQIETLPALENAAEIAAVEGIDALFVGPADLSVALDVPLEYGADAFEDAVETVVEAAEEAGIPVGVFATDPGRFGTWAELGFDFGVMGYDAGFLRAGNERLLSAYDEEWG
ncbi:HpcH/HpaI aldolase family protein [Haloarchaeobius salinus]|uniref:HpcH/HpaI aldolase family protein n=1 Tax=Haloarchaeobius salinus TaxID=1198298 RepID=UPI00210C45C9|nr:aldolase/citrate lyase family protein [Haloarchaeobius salinus]